MGRAHLGPGCTFFGRNQTARTRVTLAVGSMEEDIDLIDVRGVLAGDPERFAGIVQRWQAPLVNLAYRFVRDRERAEDMAQEALLRVFQQLARFRGDSAFSTWMFSVALNVYRSTLRRRDLPSVPLDAVAELAGQTAPHLALEEAQREELVRRAVAGLPPRYRDALTVFYFRDMDLSETARILQVPEGTAKALLHRGRKLLHRKLGGLVSTTPAAREAHA
jgi:RNA polymerase sigma-70 factor (ECF subfamily)